MRKLLLFILLGLLLATPGEILNQILSLEDVAAFRSALISYAILLFIGYFVGKALAALITSRAGAAIVYYLLFGSLGLAVEWLFLGNAPVADPLQVITQAGMFTYWGTLLLGPRLIMDPIAAPALRRSYVTFFGFMSSLYLLVAAIVPRNYGGIYFGFILFAAGTAALNFFYVQYFRRLAGTTGAGGTTEDALVHAGGASG